MSTSTFDYIVDRLAPHLGTPEHNDAGKHLSTANACSNYKVS